VEVPTVPDCATYSYVQCLECQEDYFLNKNYFLTQNLMSLRYRDNDWETQMGDFPVCQETKITNCDEYFSPDHCRKCADGFFLDRVDGQCKPYPISFVRNCVIYSSMGRCQQCVLMYRLTSSGGCVPVIPVANCVAYDSSVAFNMCAECAEGFYSKEGVQCVERQQSREIANCEVHHPTLDICKSCHNGYLLLPSGLVCKQAVLFCDRYDPESLDSGMLVCLSCLPTLYLRNNDCIMGTAPHCLIYETDLDRCAVCVNGYYIGMSGSCIQHTKIPNCETYSPNLKNKCDRCANSTMPFEIESGCQAVDRRLPKCRHYAPDQSCISCEDEYFLTHEGYCSKIPSEFPHCLKFDFRDRKCIRCHHQYQLYDGRCSRLLDFQATFTEISLSNYTLSADDSVEETDLKLEITCQKGTIPVGINHIFQCIKSDQINLFDVQLVKHCQKYQRGGCLECNDDYFLSESGNSCLDTCDGLLLKERVAFVNRVAYHVGRNQCVDGTGMPNCKYASYNSKEAMSCVGCRQGYQKVVSSFTGDYVFYEADQTEDFRLNPLNKFPPFTCQKASPAVANCDYFVGFEGRDGHFCTGCQDGYTGRVDPNEGATSLTCSKADFCRVGQVGNLLPILNVFFSCHFCQNDSKIVFLGIVGGTMEEWGTEQQAGLPNHNGNTLGCMSPNTVLTVPNCLLGVYDHSHSGYFCVACRPNFRPVKSIDSKYVKACIPIAACHRDSPPSMADACTKCANGTHMVDNHGNIDFAFCLPELIPNCFAADINSVCLYCNPGYYPNVDGDCEPFFVVNCVDSAPQTTVFPSRDFLVSMSLYGETGCNVCKPDFFPVLVDTGHTLCLPSATTSNLQVDDAVTNFIKDCEVYRKSLPLTCAECLTGTLLASDNTACVKALPNCLVVYAINHRICAQCVGGYVEVDGRCIKRDIPNCRRYLNTLNLTASACEQCDDGFYLASPRDCRKGVVEDCLEYWPHDGTKCVKCAPGFLDVDSLHGVTYCFPVPTHLACEVWDNDKLRAGILACRQCQSNYFTLTAPSPVLMVNQCIDVDDDSECTSYDIGDSFRTSTFACRGSCVNNDQYFIADDGTCAKRDNVDEACLEYDPASDSCRQCKPGYFALPDSQCTLTWEEISGCVDYASITDCSKCLHNFYLEDGFCHPVPRLIEYCVEYAGVGVCSRCAHTHFVKAEKCAKTLAKNCAVAHDEVTCLNCHPGWGFSMEGFFIHCTEVQLFECEKHTEWEPFKCLQCVPGFYPSKAGECETVTQPIEGCEYYRDEHTCSGCRADYALSADLQSCLDGESIKRHLDPNCARSVALERPVCVRCAPAAFLFQGRCLKCADFVDNCLVCNPTYPSECLICSRGHYQTETGDCKLPLLDGESASGRHLQPAGVLTLVIWPTLLLASLHLLQN
jgi:hypothetical protein